MSRVCIWNGIATIPRAFCTRREMKLLDIRFLRDVGVADARKAWQDGFDNNCRLPALLP